MEQLLSERAKDNWWTSGARPQRGREGGSKETQSVNDTENRSFICDVNGPEINSIRSESCSLKFQSGIPSTVTRKHQLRSPHIKLDSVSNNVCQKHKTHFQTINKLLTVHIFHLVSFSLHYK